jgi:hypothetical protein
MLAFSLASDARRRGTDPGTHASTPYHPPMAVPCHELCSSAHHDHASWGRSSSVTSVSIAPSDCRRLADRDFVSGQPGVGLGAQHTQAFGRGWLHVRVGFGQSCALAGLATQCPTSGPQLTRWNEVPALSKPVAPKRDRRLREGGCHNDHGGHAELLPVRSWRTVVGTLSDASQRRHHGDDCPGGGEAGSLSRQSRHSPPTRTRTARHMRQMPIWGLLRFMRGRPAKLSAPRAAILRHAREPAEGQVRALATERCTGS